MAGTVALLGVTVHAITMNSAGWYSSILTAVVVVAALVIGVRTVARFFRGYVDGRWAGLIFESMIVGTVAAALFKHHGGWALAVLAAWGCLVLIVTVDPAQARRQLVRAWRTRPRLRRRTADPSSSWYLALMEAADNGTAHPRCICGLDPTGTGPRRANCRIHGRRQL